MSDSTFTAHVDTFARDHLPPREEQPEYVLELPGLRFPERLNCAAELLDRHVRDGRGDRTCVSAPAGPSWTYAELQRQADRIAHVLVAECANKRCLATACCCARPTSRCSSPAGSR